jgi:endogenous inhibitor of DNA gyrase (YacG/DUF329 family)
MSQTSVKCDYCDKEVTDPERVKRGSHFCSNFCEGTVCNGEVGKN